METMHVPENEIAQGNSKVKSLTFESIRSSHCDKTDCFIQITSSDIAHWRKEEKAPILFPSKRLLRLEKTLT